MYQIRDVFQVKFGKIDQAVALFSQLPNLTSGKVVLGHHFELLTDISGEMYSLVSDYVVEDLAEFTAMLELQFAQPEFERWFKQFQLFVEGGRREVYSIEGPFKTWSRAGVVVVREAYRAYKWQIRPAVELLQRYGKLLEGFGVGQNARILTDLTGPMFQAIVEIETENVSSWETKRRTMYREIEFQAWFNKMMTSIEAGAHQFYRVEFTGE